MENFNLEKLNNADDFNKLMRGSSNTFLQRLALQHGVSKGVTSGKAAVRDFMLGEQNVGKEFAALVGPYRAHAIRFEGSELVEESFDPNSDVFMSIQEGQKKWKQGCSAGPEFLIYLPEYRAFGTLHFARGSLRNARAAFVAGQKKELVTVTSELTGNPKKRQWPIPIVVPHAGATAFQDLPSQEELDEAIKQFYAPTREEEVTATSGRPR